MDNENGIGNGEAVIAKQEQKRQRRKKKKVSKTLKVKKSYQRILWGVLLLAFLVSLSRIVPKIIRAHQKSSTINTRKM